MINQYFILKGLRKIVSYFTKDQNNKMDAIESADVISSKMMDLLLSDKPAMIARFGSTELVTIVNFVGVQSQNKSVWKYILGKSLPWWWNENVINQMQNWSGFFPPKIDKIEEFCTLMIEDTKEVDILASWLSNERYLQEHLQNAVLVKGIYIEPFWSAIPWTKVLKGKRVLVIHPFAQQIESQYQMRELLFANQDILPEFHLICIQAVQSLGGDCDKFDTWFDALEYMKNEINRVDFDICLIGCGAYGFPLAAHVKRMGKKAVHLGGVLQILFGIKGKRWMNPNYNSKHNYTTLMNEYWKYPADVFRPKNANSVEGACYW